ncbi:cyclic pyranopterin phosphate synthase [Nakamurella panacisegetis]|uniref:GTP 3',8-cyclase n=1 Tax=Nakamurella panacisegetis TaxID=1090615 RepID=A0A1H0J7T8_9ACTN|nr:GTP 3',8-cyclase MoaA [Nakamurella panacisegetis]SDO39401.1 cyclic pyranopterin phosphate synthase [Nakamurella panacisegetis]
MTSTALGIPMVGARRADGDTAAERAARGPSPFLIDSHGRRAIDLRVSLTDKCNLRCTYCMPAEGLDWMPGQELLTDEELLRLIRLAVDSLGVTEVRFTGGEPLLRKGILGLISEVGRFPSRPEMSLTTNGIGFARRAEDFAAAGLDRINISLDSLDPSTFIQLTRRDRHRDVIAALDAAAKAGLGPVKINAVLLRGINDHEAADLLAFAVERGYQLRFIEQMPLDAGHGWNRTSMVTADEIQTALSARFRLTPHRAARAGAPAELFDVDGGPGTVGIIASVTRPFCGDCDRTRLTADGQVRSCLFSRSETDLRAMLRAGATDDEIADTWRLAMWRKLPGHGINDPSFLQPDRPMSAIGG